MVLDPKNPKLIVVWTIYQIWIHINILIYLLDAIQLLNSTFINKNRWLKSTIKINKISLKINGLNTT